MRPIAAHQGLRDAGADVVVHVAEVGAFWIHLYVLLLELGGVFRIQIRGRTLEARGEHIVLLSAGTSEPIVNHVGLTFERE